MIITRVTLLTKTAVTAPMDADPAITWTVSMTDTYFPLCLFLWLRRGSGGGHSSTSVYDSWMNCGEPGYAPYALAAGQAGPYSTSALAG